MVNFTFVVVCMKFAPRYHGDSVTRPVSQCVLLTLLQTDMGYIGNSSMVAFLVIQ